jgi:predicted alpha/beta-hydrolase family hydrolase
MRNETAIIPVGAQEQVSGILTIPDEPDYERGIILAHGANNDLNHPLLAFFAEGLAERSYLALRFNFLYREKGKQNLDSQEVLYSTWESAYHFLASHSDYRLKEIIAAGKSLGGRIASQMVAAGMLPVARLIFLGYPLHAPGRPDKLRDRHLYDINAPMLYFSGTRDPFAKLDLLQSVLSRLTAPWELMIIDGGDHSFHVPGSVAADQQEIYQNMLTKACNWLRTEV